MAPACGESVALKFTSQAPRWPRVSVSACTCPVRQKAPTCSAESSERVPAGSPACQAVSAWNDSLGSARSQICAYSVNRPMRPPAAASFHL